MRCDTRCEKNWSIRWCQRGGGLQPTAPSFVTRERSRPRPAPSSTPISKWNTRVGKAFCHFASHTSCWSRCDFAASLAASAFERFDGGTGLGSRLRARFPSDRATVSSSRNTSGVGDGRGMEVERGRPRLSVGVGLGAVLVLTLPRTARAGPAMLSRAVLSLMPSSVLSFTAAERDMGDGRRPWSSCRCGDGTVAVVDMRCAARGEQQAERAISAEENREREEERTRTQRLNKIKTQSQRCRMFGRRVRPP